MTLLSCFFANSSVPKRSKRFKNAVVVRSTSTTRAGYVADFLAPGFRANAMQITEPGKTFLCMDLSRSTLT
jgi:hypothetical protein